MISGVEAHAQIISQLLDELDGEPALYRFLPQWGEFLWLLGWVALAGVLGWRTRRPFALVMMVGLAVLVIWGRRAGPKVPVVAAHGRADDGLCVGHGAGGSPKSPLSH